MYSLQLQTIVDSQSWLAGGGLLSPAPLSFVRRKDTSQLVPLLVLLRLTHQALKYRRLTIAGPLEGKVLLYFCSPRSPASSAMAS